MIVPPAGEFTDASDLQDMVIEVFMLHKEEDDNSSGYQNGPHNLQGYQIESRCQQCQPH